MKISPGKRTNCRYIIRFCLLIAGICCGPISVGQIIGYSSPAMLHIEQLKIMTSSQMALFASLMNIGGMIGSLLVGSMLDRFGRKWTQVSTAVPVLIGWFLIGSANEHGPNMKLFLFYSGRILTGVSAGMCMTSSSVYLIEIAPTVWRGAVGCCNQLGITFGIFLVYFLGMLVKDFVLLAHLGSLYPFLMVVTTLFAPESPRWLLSKERRVEASNALSRLREPYYDVEEELRDIEESLLQEKSNSANAQRQWRDYLKPDCLIPLRIAVGLMVFQQMSGINVVMFYSSRIFKSAGYGISDAYCPPIVIGIVQVLVTIVSVRLMDRHGRRHLLGMASFLMCSALFCLSIFYLSKTSAGWIALICLIVYIVGFSIGWGPIPMLISAEVFPMWARSFAGGVSIFTMWLTSFLVTQSFPALILVLGPAACFGIFGVGALMGSVFVRKLVPETKGKSLEEIQLFFASRAAKSVAAAVRSV